MGLLKASSKMHLQERVGLSTGTATILRNRLKDAERKLSRLTHQLTMDATTGLHNASVLHAELGTLLSSDDNPKAVMFITTNDIFGLMKKTYSTKMTEWVLYQSSQRIHRVVGSHGRVYHTKENEFLVYLPKIRSKEEIYGLGRTLHEHLEKNHVMGGYTIGVGFNIGIAFYPEHGKVKSDLLRSADIALAEAIKLKKPFYPFNPQLKERMTEHVELRNGILAALQAQSDPSVKPQLELWFQPQVQVRHWKTPRAGWDVVGAEVLIRWTHPSLGPVSPAKFIPIAEETGLIIPLSRWIVHNSISHYAELQGLGYRDISLSVNLSARQLTSEDLVGPLAETLRRRNLPPGRFKLEITEGGVIENYVTVVAKLQGLRDLGFPILLDDFGTGYSSLSYLKKLPVDVLKIDKSFIDGLPQDKADCSLVKAIINMAAELDMGTIVEGTETQAQVDWLYDHGCKIFQGYFFSKPLRFRDFLAFIDKCRSGVME